MWLMSSPEWENANEGINIVLGPHETLHRMACHPKREADCFVAPHIKPLQWYYVWPWLLTTYIRDAFDQVSCFSFVHALPRYQSRPVMVRHEAMTFTVIPMKQFSFANIPASLFVPLTFQSTPIGTVVICLPAVRSRLPKSTTFADGLFLWHPS